MGNFALFPKGALPENRLACTAALKENRDLMIQLCLKYDLQILNTFYDYIEYKKNK